MLRPGSRAPDFELPSSTGELVKLSDLLKKGRVVLYFYPRAGTPGCTREACGFRDRYEEIAGKGAVILGVSPDRPEDLEHFKKRLGIPFTLLSDSGKRVARLYNALTLGGLMVKRVTYVIERDGVIIHAHEGAMPSRHIEEAIKFLDQSVKPSW